jgi:hypothetical protein
MMTADAAQLPRPLMRVTFAVPADILSAATMKAVC